MNSAIEAIGKNYKGTNIHAPLARGLKSDHGISHDCQCQCDCSECAGGDTGDD